MENLSESIRCTRACLRHSQVDADAEVDVPSPDRDTYFHTLLRVATVSRNRVFHQDASTASAL